MYRTKSFDKLLSKQLQNSEVARGYIIESMSGDEPLTLVEALLDLMDTMGHKEYAKLVKMQPSAIARIVAKGDIPKIETLNRLLAPFQLRAKLDVEKVA